MVDHHVDRPGVEVRQRTQLTGPNHPIEFNTSNNLTNPHTQQSFIGTTDNECIMQSTKTNPTHHSLIGWTTWWLWRGAYTRSHPELGRENPQRPWYCVLRHGRVGRRQVFQPINTHQNRPKTTQATKGGFMVF